MGSLIKNELYKAIRLKRLYLLMLLALVIEIACGLQSKFGSAPPELQKINGQYFPLLLFDNLPYLFVIFATVFIADSWVDEYRNGVLRVQLYRPVNRTAFLSAKVISFFVCAVGLMGFTLLSSYAVGTITFGWGENTNLDNVMLVLKSGAVTLLPVLGFGLILLFIAVLTDSMPITVGGAMGLLLVSQLLEVTEGLRDYSIIYMIRTFYKNLFIHFKPESVIINIEVIVAYIIIFYIGSVLLFRKKDVLV